MKWRPHEPYAVGLERIAKELFRPLYIGLRHGKRRLMSSRCRHFKPTPSIPVVCFYWYHLGTDKAHQFTHFCGSPNYKGRLCPSQGRNPQEQEEDSFE